MLVCDRWIGVRVLGVDEDTPETLREFQLPLPKQRGRIREGEVLALEVATIAD